MQTGVTTKVSVDSNGLEGNNSSYSTSISDDGRYVVFHSLATNFVSSDTNGSSDVFLHDNTTNETVRISIKTDGTESNSGSENGSVSPDGTKVAFTSFSTNLIDSVVSTGSGNYYLASVTPPDANAVVISSIHTSTDKYSATITWTTSKVASTKVDYGITSSYGNTTEETDKSPRVTSHTVVIPNLFGCKVYHFKVTSEDAISQSGYSSDMTFKTAGCSNNGGGPGSKPFINTVVLDCINGNLYSPSTGMKCTNFNINNPALDSHTQVSKFIFTKKLQVGLKDIEVSELQKYLNKKGENLLTDGAFGKLTKIALIKFQKLNGLGSDGVVGPKTREILNK